MARTSLQAAMDAADMAFRSLATVVVIRRDSWDLFGGCLALFAHNWDFDHDRRVLEMYPSRILH